VVQEAKQPKEYTWVIIHEEPLENWLVGGLTIQEVKAKMMQEKK
jgi:phenylpyruvate tautomerase PptA (4-oxalocrotonate tautomerase family)